MLKLVDDTRSSDVLIKTHREIESFRREQESKRVHRVPQESSRCFLPSFSSFDNNAESREKIGKMS